VVEEMPRRVGELDPYSCPPDRAVVSSPVRAYIYALANWRTETTNLAGELTANCGELAN
jgi:hypothetical protein